MTWSTLSAADPYSTAQSAWACAVYPEPSRASWHCLTAWPTSTLLSTSSADLGCRPCGRAWTVAFEIRRCLASRFDYPQHLVHRYLDSLDPHRNPCVCVRSIAYAYIPRWLDTSVLCWPGQIVVNNAAQQGSRADLQQAAVCLYPSRARVPVSATTATIHLLSAVVIKHIQTHALQAAKDAQHVGGWHFERYQSPGGPHQQASIV